MATFYPNPEDIRTHAFPSSSGEGSTPHNFTPRTPAFCGTGPTTGGGTAVTSTCLIWPVGIDQLDPTVPIQDQLGLQVCLAPALSQDAASPALLPLLRLETAVLPGHYNPPC